MPGEYEFFMKPKISVYIATSLDGFIAREDGTLDWLEGSSGGEEDAGDDVDASGSGAGAEDYGFSEFLSSVDALVMGRGTYEFVAALDMWGYGELRVVVLSTTLSAGDVAPHLEGKVEFLAMEPVDLVAKLGSEGVGHIYVDGGVTIQRFLRAGLIDELIISRMPVLLGSGIPLFGELSADVQLKHVETTSFESGMVQSRYAVER
jgi:dihydrofolate reductase